MMRSIDDDDDEDDDDEPGESVCPYCSSTGSCRHILLYVDMTFREVLGGQLADAFAQRWSGLLASQQEAPGFDERWAFDELLEAAADLANAQAYHVDESGPGSSSSMTTLYVSSLAKARQAVQAFEAAKPGPSST